MWKGPDLVMAACRDVFGEPIIIERAPDTYTVRGIFELVTNVDEGPGYADVLNYDAEVAFRKSDLAKIPITLRTKDIITVPSIGRSFEIISPEDDYFARGRYLLKDV